MRKVVCPIWNLIFDLHLASNIPKMYSVWNSTEQNVSLELKKIAYLVRKIQLSVFVSRFDATCYNMIIAQIVADAAHLQKTQPFGCGACLGGRRCYILARPNSDSCSKFYSISKQIFEVIMKLLEHLLQEMTSIV